MRIYAGKNAIPGTIVKLTHPNPNYDIGEGNPKVGTIWECTGEIIRVNGGSIRVNWSNGTQNVYVNGELSTDGNTGICDSIW
jgi:hypothetical protein